MEKKVKHRNRLALKGSALRNSILAVSFVILLLILSLSYSQSLFVRHLDRVSIVFYGVKPVLYSFGLQDDTHYQISFAADWIAQVPGCYGDYRIGALAKLANYQKDPQLIKRVFSSIAYVPVEYYVSRGEQIYYGTNVASNNEFPIGDLFFSNSNIHFFDKLYIAGLFLTTPRYKFKTLKYPITSTNNLDISTFYDSTRGNFYEAALKKERNTVQILYHERYKTAVNLSHILEGAGLHVVDISQNNLFVDQCSIVESGEPTLTARRLSSILGCGIQKGKTDLYDTIVILGDKEREWNICSTNAQ